jgi:hypothetical protein
MFLNVLAFLLGALVLYAICQPRREGLSADYTNDESESTMVLAKKNETNIADLKKRVETILAMGDQVTRIQQSCDANTESIKTLVDSCQ